MPRLSTSDPRCPICCKPASAQHMPFCSDTCQDRDLLNWLDENYVAPGHPADEALDND